MKTTIDISTALLRQARRLAARERTTFKARERTTFKAIVERDVRRAVLETTPASAWLS